MRKLALKLPAVVGDVFDLCFPRRCVLCAALDDLSDPLCPACTAQLSLQSNASACERCASPIQSPGAPCPWCHGQGRSPLTKIVRLGVYEQPLSRLVKQLKYHDAWPIADLLADRLFEHPPARSLLDQIDAIVPPGSDIGQIQMTYDPPAVTNPTQRRRPLAERAA